MFNLVDINFIDLNVAKSSVTKILKVGIVSNKSFYLRVKDIQDIIDALMND